MALTPDESRCTVNIPGFESTGEAYRIVEELEEMVLFDGFVTPAYVGFQFKGFDDVDVPATAFINGKARDAFYSAFEALCEKEREDARETRREANLWLTQNGFDRDDRDDHPDD
jgi:hypothetical protein